MVPAAFILFLTASMSFNMVAACDRRDDIDGKVSEAFGPKPTTSRHASLVSVEGAIDDAKATGKSYRQACNDVYMEVAPNRNHNPVALYHNPNPNAISLP